MHSGTTPPRRPLPQPPRSYPGLPSSPDPRSLSRRRWGLRRETDPQPMAADAVQGGRAYLLRAPLPWHRTGTLAPIRQGVRGTRDGTTVVHWLGGSGVLHGLWRWCIAWWRWWCIAGWVSGDVWVRCVVVTTCTLCCCLGTLVRCRPHTTGPHSEREASAGEGGASALPPAILSQLGASSVRNHCAQV